MTGVAGEPNIRQRHFVAIATAEYDDDFFKPLGGVRKEVEDIWRWLLDKQLRDRRFVQEHVELAENPSQVAIEAAFRHADTRVQWRWNDAAVIYITGHGIIKKSNPDANGQVSEHHYLALKSTKETTPASSAIQTDTLFGWLEELKMDYLLVIVDACFAGSVTQEVDRIADKKWLILTSAAGDQPAEVGALTGAIKQFINKSRQYNTEDRYFRVKMFCDQVNSLLPIGQHAEKIYKGAAYDPHPCLPNPAYRPSDQVTTSPARRQLALPKSALELHNAARAQPGWLFTGREKLMRSLADAIKAPGVTLVSGSAGCGKSTALSRLVTLADAAFQARYKDEIPADLLPKISPVHVAVSARMRSNEALLAELCLLLEAPVAEHKTGDPNLGDYMNALRAHVIKEAPVTIVIDALDEATEKNKLVTEVLPQLRKGLEEKLCLLLSVRSLGGDVVVGDADHGRESLADQAEAKLSAQRISVDRSPWWEPQDIRVFVSNVLKNTPESPYHDQDVTDLATVICEASDRSYLLAQFAANSLAERKGIIISANDKEWRADLNLGLIGILRNDLAASFSSQKDRRRGVMLLRAVAFARGNGLPWYRVWPRMATAVDDDEADNADHSYGDGDVEWLLDSRLNAYLVTDRQDDLTVYRILHNQLQEALKYHWRDLLQEPAESGQPVILPAESAERIKDVEARIARELRTLIREEPSAAVNRLPSAYVRRHLAEHALAGGVLRRLPAAFLPYLDLAPLLAAVSVAPDRRELEQSVPWLPVIRRVAHLWNWERPAANAAAIEMWKALTAPGWLAEIGGPWQVPWAGGRPDDGNILGRHDGQVRAAAAAELAGQPIAVTGGRDGKLRVWDLSKGMSGGEPIQTGGGEIQCVAIARLPEGTGRSAGPTVAVTGSADGAIRVWELPSGRAVGDPLASGGGKVEAVATATLPDGRVVVIAADQAGTIRTWDLVTREPVGDERPTGPNLALGLATATVGGQVLGLATGKDGGLLLWDLATGIPVADRLLMPPSVLPFNTQTAPDGRTIAAAVVGGRAIAVTGYLDRLLVWDLAAREMREELAGRDGTVKSIAVAGHGGRIIAVAGGGRQVTAWDLTADGRTIGNPLTGHDASVDTVAIIGSADGGTLAVSAGRDQSVRLWEIADQLTPRTKPWPGERAEVNAVAASPVRALAAVSNVVQVRDLEQGTLLTSLTGQAGIVMSLAAAELPDDDALVVAGSWDGAIQAWQLSDHSRSWHTAYLHRGPLLAIATATLADGRIIAVTGGWDHQVRIWSPFAETEVGVPLPGHRGSVRAVVTTASPEGRLLAISGGQDGHLHVSDLDAHVNPATASAWPAVDADSGVKIASLAVADDPDGPLRVIAGGEDGTVRVIGLRDGRVIGEPWQAQPSEVRAIAAGRLSDGRAAVFTGGADPWVQAWDIATGEAIGEPLPTPGPVLGMTRAAVPLRLLIGTTGAAVVQPQHGPR